MPSLFEYSRRTRQMRSREVMQLVRAVWSTANNVNYHSSSQCFDILHCNNFHTTALCIRVLRKQWAIFLTLLGYKKLKIKYAWLVYTRLGSETHTHACMCISIYISCSVVNACSSLKKRFLCMIYALAIYLHAICMLRCMLVVEAWSSDLKLDLCEQLSYCCISYCCMPVHSYYYCAMEV
jgi:hypothetical protein